MFHFFAVLWPFQNIILYRVTVALYLDMRYNIVNYVQKESEREMARVIRMITVILAAVSVLIYGAASIYVGTHTDHNGPKIEMKEKEVTVSVEDGQEKLLEGVKGTDKKDGDVTDSLVVESTGAFFEKGKRPATIAAFDSDYNVAKAERMIVYSDYVSPRISITKPLRAPVNDSRKLSEGIRVKDCLDGDITDNVQITPAEEGLNYNVPGEYAMKLIVSNSAGDVVEYPVTVELYDYSLDAVKVKPVLSQYLVYTKVGQAIDPWAYLVGAEKHGTEYLWSGSTTPPISSSQVQIEGSVDYQTTGTYELRFLADDGSGNVGITRMFVIVEE